MNTAWHPTVHSHFTASVAALDSLGTSQLYICRSPFQILTETCGICYKWSVKGYGHEIEVKYECTCQQKVNVTAVE
jgi:lysyl-tRNA synthetase class I